MSVACGAECVFFLGCSRWLWKRCTYVGSDDSTTWPPATAEEFEPIPRICTLILAVYENDLRNPTTIPNAGVVNPDWVVKRVSYEQTLGHAPPYLIYCDHRHREIVLAIRGLNLYKETDYKLLLDNRLGKQMFDGGYVHHGLLKSAIWLLNQESETLKKLWIENGKSYKMIFAGHSLGSGVAALLTVVVVNHRHRLGGIPRNLIQCYPLAPARCMSLNMAVKYADVIHSVILQKMTSIYNMEDEIATVNRAAMYDVTELCITCHLTQDDFLPRTATPLEDIFKSLFWDTFISEEKKLKDPRRLYAPGRMYHIVERKFCRCGRFPPEVRTAIPVDGRFEHIVLSCNATSDHAILWIQREAEKALQLMKEKSAAASTTAPSIQKMERKKTFEDEHKNALEKALSLNVPYAVAPGEESLCDAEDEPSPASTEETSRGKSDSKANWDELVEKLFRKNKSEETISLKEFAPI
ncbi:hypothetical protein V2J09_015149 [Rumex salicifolius]